MSSTRTACFSITVFGLFMIGAQMSSQLWEMNQEEMVTWMRSVKVQPASSRAARSTATLPTEPNIETKEPSDSNVQIEITPQTTIELTPSAEPQPHTTPPHASPLPQSVPQESPPTTTSDRYCVAWRQTGECRANGPREPKLDGKCEDQIESGRSGFCECERNRTVRYSCSHSQLNCHEICLTDNPRNIYVKNIPQIIHQTLKSTKSDTWHAYQRASIRSWASQNPEFEHILYSDDDMLAFVTKHYPNMLDSFHNLPVIGKADMFRYMVLHTHGGFYADVDVDCVKPIDSWGIRDAKFVIGVEFDTPNNNFRELGFARKYQFCQWTMGAAPGHPILREIIDFIDRSVKAKGKIETEHFAIIDTTGPGAWTDEILKYLDSISESHSVGRHGDVLILPYEAMAYPGYPGRDYHADLSKQVVRHGFAGTWKSP